MYKISSKNLTIIIIGVLLGIIFSWWWYKSQAQFILPSSDVASEQTVIDQDGQEKTIMITNNIKHSVPLDEIIGGGPPKDGIPSIDNPKFISVAEADFLDDSDPGIAVSINGEDKFYPFQILVWHEIVNDKFQGKRVLITYCPLCLLGIVFDPEVNGERVEFGTSGKLWQSNLVMYDRKTNSLWSQVLGEAIVGEMTGTRLQTLPSDRMQFGEWKKQFPNGKVLSKDTGAIRTYGFDPYGDYYTSDNILFPVESADDNRLEKKDFILGVVVDDQAKAYYTEAVKNVGEVRDEFVNTIIIARYDKDLDVVRLFREVDGKLERINPVGGFWFAWVAAHPDTELYK